MKIQVHLEILIIFCCSLCLYIECSPSFADGVQTCSEDWRRQGCYANDNDKYTKDYTTMLINWRFDIKWDKKRFPKFIQKLTCTCAREARNANLTAFALFWWGQCYPVTLDEIEALDDKSDKSDSCYKGDGSYARCEGKSDVSCIGDHRAVYIYNMAPINGKYGDWNSWSACSLSCGSGLRKRSRNCDSPPPSSRGDACKGPSIEETACNEEDCPSSYSCLDGTQSLVDSFRNSYICSKRGAFVIGSEQEVINKCNNDISCTGYDYRKKGNSGYVCTQQHYPGYSTKCCGYKLCKKDGVSTK